MLAEHLSESDVSTHLSYLLKRPVSFKLRITPNKELALIDVAILFTGLDNDNAGKTVRRLLEQFPDVRSNRSNFKFPGRGQRAVDVAPLAEALEFAFLLPGRNAAKVRKEAAKLLVRYFRRLLEQFPDFHSNRVKFKFPGRGRQTVDVAPLADALEFAFLLPGAEDVPRTSTRDSWHTV